MGVNNDSNATSAKKTNTVPLEENTFRVTVLEHISWDAYDEKKQCFYPGKEDNKPISGRKFLIKMPDGSKRTETTNSDGVIELKDQKPTDKYEVTFEPESAKLNNKYHLFYNRSTPVKKKL